MQNLQYYYSGLNKIENEIKKLKNRLQKKRNNFKCIISLRGMGKSLVSSKELEHSVEKAKNSLFKNR